MEPTENLKDYRKKFKHRILSHNYSNLKTENHSESIRWNKKNMGTYNSQRTGHLILLQTGDWLAR